MILQYLDEYTLDGVEDRFQIYLTCFRILDAVGDPRAREFLANAYHLLQVQTDGIKDATIRESFLINVPSNRNLAMEFEAIME